MRTMSAEPFFIFNPAPHATPIGDAVGLVEDKHGGQVLLNGTLTYVRAAGDTADRRATAMNLWRIKAATA